MGLFESKLRLSNAAQYPVIAVVHPTQVNMGYIRSLTIRLLNLAQIKAEFGASEACEVPPGMVKLLSKETLPFQERRPYVTILKSMKGTEEETTWICINYRPPPNRNIIVSPEGSAVLAKKGTIWTPETGGEPYFPEPKLDFF